MDIEIANEVGIRDGTFSKFRKLTAWWALLLLTPMQKLNCMQESECPLANFQKEGDSFLNDIVTTNEIWVLHTTVESKKASKKWRRW